jgi:hypothetical protein
MEDSATWEYRHQRRRRLAKDEIEELEYLTISPKEYCRQRRLAKKEITVGWHPPSIFKAKHSYFRNTPILKTETLLFSKRLYEAPLFSKHPYILAESPLLFFWANHFGKRRFGFLIMELLCIERVKLSGWKSDTDAWRCESVVTRAGRERVLAR